MWKFLQKIKTPKKTTSIPPIIQKGCSTSTGFSLDNRKENSTSKLYPVDNKFKFIQENDSISVIQKHPLLLEAVKKNYQITGLASFKDPQNNINLQKLTAYICYFWFSDEHYLDPLYIKVKNCLSLPSDLFTSSPVDEKFIKHIFSLKQHFICLINNNKEFDIAELMGRFHYVDFSSYDNGKTTVNLWIECYVAEKTLGISRLSTHKQVAFINHENLMISSKDESNKYPNTNIFKPYESLAQINQPFSDLQIYSHFINVNGECITRSLYKDVKSSYHGANKGHLIIDTELTKDTNSLKGYINQFIYVIKTKITQADAATDITAAKDLLENINTIILPLFAEKDPNLSKILKNFNKIMDGELFTSSLSALGLNFSKVVSSLDQLDPQDLQALHTISSNIETLTNEKGSQDIELFLNKSWVQPYKVNYEIFKFFKLVPTSLQLQITANFQKFLTL